MAIVTPHQDVERHRLSTLMTPHIQKIISMADSGDALSRNVVEKYKKVQVKEPASEDVVACEKAINDWIEANSGSK